MGDTYFPSTRSQRNGRILGIVLTLLGGASVYLSGMFLSGWFWTLLVLFFGTSGWLAYSVYRSVGNPIAFGVVYLVVSALIAGAMVLSQIPGLIILHLFYTAACVVMIKWKSSPQTNESALRH